MYTLHGNSLGYVLYALSQLLLVCKLVSFPGLSHIYYPRNTRIHGLGSHWRECCVCPGTVLGWANVTHTHMQETLLLVCGYFCGERPGNYRLHVNSAVTCKLSPGTQWSPEVLYTLLCNYILSLFIPGKTIFLELLL